MGKADTGNIKEQQIQVANGSSGYRLQMGTADIDNKWEQQIYILLFVHGDIYNAKTLFTRYHKPVMSILSGFVLKSSQIVM
jgi:hypothetical protein